MMNPNAMMQARWDRLRAAYRAGLPALTVAWGRELVTDHPECAPAWRLIGSALVELGRYHEAEYALGRTLAVCPPDRLWIPLAEMGHLYRSRGDFRAAAAWYRRAIGNRPEEAAGHIHLGLVLAREGRLHEAETVLRAATGCEEGCRDAAFLNLGLVLRALERHDEAADCFEAALRIDPKYQAARKALRDVQRTLKLFRGSTRKVGRAPAAPRRTDAPRKRRAAVA